MVTVIKTKEVIDVIVVFAGNKARPHSFKWAGKKFVVEKINLSYTQRVGADKIIYYSVTSEGNYFKLIFNTNEMTWYIEEVVSE